MMSMDTEFGKIVTAAITPFTADNEVDYDEFRRLVRFLVENGSDSIVVAGTTGESPTLSDAEKLKLVSVAVAELGDEYPVIAGTGSNNTAHTVELTKAAVEAGARGILAVTPYYNKPPRAGLVKHFEAIAKAAGSAKVMLYNIPARSVINMPADLIAELAEIDNVVALKQANPDLSELRSVRSLAPNLAVYAGDDVSLMPMLPEGIVGIVSVASHVAGVRMREVIDLFQSGDEAAARKLSANLDDVYETLSLTTNPIPVKSAMEVLGFSVGQPRLPLVAATGVQRDKIQAMLERNELVAAHV